MIKHAGKSYDDMNDRPYELTKRAVRNWRFNECEVVIVHGMPEGVGKSVYVSHALADANGWLNCKEPDKVKWMYKHAGERPVDTPIWEADYMANKPFILYKPEEVVSFLMDRMTKVLGDEFGERTLKVPMFHWDDGGTWLNGMEYQDLFVKAFMEFLPLARSMCGLVVISTPVEEWVLKKLHAASGVIHCPVTKLKDNSEAVWRPRECKAYRKVKNAYHTRSFPQYQWHDMFTAIEPDDYHAWYRPRRDHYTLMAVAKMQLALQKKKGSGLDVGDDEAVLAQVRGSVDASYDKAKELLEIIPQVAEKIG